MLSQDDLDALNRIAAALERIADAGERISPKETKKERRPATLGTAAYSEEEKEKQRLRENFKAKASR